MTKNMTNKIAAALADTARWIYGLVIAFMMLMVLIFYSISDFAYKTEFRHHNILYMVIGVLLWFLIYIIITYVPVKIKKYIADHENMFIGIATVVFFLILACITYQYYFSTGWDTGVLLDVSSKLSEGAQFASGSFESVYLSRYPNNLLITFLYKIMWQMGIGLFGMVLVMCLISAVTGLLCFKTAYLWKNSHKASWMVWIMYVMFVGVSPWVSIPYSDSMGLIFPVLILYLYFLIRNKKHTGIKSALLMMAVVFGYHIKPQVVITLIAVGIVIFLNAITKGIKKKDIQWKNIICGLCGVIVMELAVSGAVSTLRVDIDKESGFTPEHYMMMGLNQYTQGGYCEDDVKFTVDSKMVNGEVSKAQGRKKDLEMVVKRIKDYGVSGMIGHTVQKSLNLYGDGTMAWGKEGNFYMGMLPEPNDNIAPAIRSFYYDQGEKNELFKDYSQMMWMAVILGTFFLFLFRSKKWNTEEMAIMLSILGITLFHLIFEVRARYLYIYLPIYVLAAFGGMDLLYQKIVRRIKNKKS